MPDSRTFLRLAPLALLLCLLPAFATAQTTPERPAAPVHISADHFRFDQQKGVGDYRGRVVVTQNKLTIKGDALNILAPGNGPIQQLTMTGGPARFEDTTADGKHITGEARTMEYSPADQRIVLTGDARIEQSGNTFRAARITYDIRRDVVDAGAPGQRIEATFTPAGQPAGTPKP